VDDATLRVDWVDAAEPELDLIEEIKLDNPAEVVVVVVAAGLARAAAGARAKTKMVEKRILGELGSSAFSPSLSTNIYTLQG